MRLYRQHDLDLLYLYKLSGFSIQKAVKAAMYAYINQQDTVIRPPTPELGSVVLPKYAQFHIYLSEKKDAELIKWIKSITSGYRNSLLKNMLRRYLYQPTILPYLSGKNICFAQESQIKEKKEHNIRSGKKKQNSSGVKEAIPNNDTSVIEDIMNAPLPQEKQDAVYTEADEVLQSPLTQEDSSDFDILNEFEAMMENY